MTEPMRDRRRILLGLGWLVLVAGLGLSAVLYGQAAPTGGEALGYEVIDGVAYPRSLEDTKQYALQMERFGGKGLVLMDSLLRFLDSLAHGRRLAVVVGVASVLASLILFHAARHPSFWTTGEDDPDDAGDGKGF